MTPALDTERGRKAINYAGIGISLGLVSILAFLTWALVFRTIPVENQNVLTVVVGILSAQIGHIVGFFFGTSLQSRKQEDTNDALVRVLEAKQDKESGKITLKHGQSANISDDVRGTTIEKEK